MNLKKPFALLAALCVMGALTGCGEDSSTAPVSTTTTAKTTAATTVPTTTTVATTTTTAPLVADANAITFDTPSLYSAHCMAEKNFENDESNCKLSVVDYKGDKKLRVQVLDKDKSDTYKVPKLVFDLAGLIGAENTGKIGHISIDFTCVAQELWKNEDGSEALVVGNFLGAIAGNIAAEKGYDADKVLTQNDWANHIEFKLDDWENAEHTWRVETDIPALLAVNGYAENFDKATLVIMRWGQTNQVDFLIDNITIFDKDGKSMPIQYDATKDAVTVETMSAPAAGTDAAATTAAQTTTTTAA